jgi:GNAT superfamily N-acetyltransferase
LLEQLGYPPPVEDLARRVDRFATSASDRLVVAELDGRVVGLAGIHVSLALEYDEPAAKLSAIVVDESCRGEGVGGALVAAIEEEARARGCRLLFLTTADRRTEAHAFYRRHGFEETGRRFAKWLD